MGILITSLIAFFFGYLYGYKLKPNRRLREKLKQIDEQCKAVLEEGNKGVYKTIVMDNNQSSELVVEVKELAVTERGQVKVQYLSAFYSNPAFRNKKGDALLHEVHGLLGEYLPLNEIEWFETNKRHENIREFVDSLHNTYKKQFRA